MNPAAAKARNETKKKCGKFYFFMGNYCFVVCCLEFKKNYFHKSLSYHSDKIM